MIDTDNQCSVELTVNVIANKWKIYILKELMKGSKRFNQLDKSIDKISQKMLTQNLREMEKTGLVSRKVYAEVPPRVEYSLTDLGKTLEPVMVKMSEWGDMYKRYLSQQNNT